MICDLFFFCFVLLAFFVCFLVQQRGGLPQVNTVVKIDDEYGVVVAIRPDNEYYPGELDYHHCIEVLIVDPSVQESEQLVALNNGSQVFCLDDLDVQRDGRPDDTERYIQCYIYGDYQNSERTKEKKEKEQAVTDLDVCLRFFGFVLHLVFSKPMYFCFRGFNIFVAIGSRIKTRKCK